MAAKSAGIYRKLDHEMQEQEGVVANGETAEAEGEEDDDFPDVFSDEDSGSKKDVSTEAELENIPTRRRSVLKHSGSTSSISKSPRAGQQQKRVSFSSVPSERRRRVSNGTHSFLHFYNRM